MHIICGENLSILLKFKPTDSGIKGNGSHYLLNTTPEVILSSVTLDLVIEERGIQCRFDFLNLSIGLLIILM